MTDEFNDDLTEDERPVLAARPNPNGSLATDDSGFYRITDPLTGAGLFTSNTDPQFSGLDPITGGTAPTGTDVGFGAALRREIAAGVKNGDFALGPPDITMPISADNPLPYWTWTPSSDAHVIPTWAASATGSGGSIKFTCSTSSSNEGYLEQLVPINASSAKSYAIMAGAWFTAGTGAIPDGNAAGQLLAVDAVTTTGSEINGAVVAGGESRVWMGIPSTTGYWLRLRVYVEGNGFGTIFLNEVRVIQGPDHYVITETDGGSYTPGILKQTNGTVYLGAQASISGGAVAGSTGGTVSVSGSLRLPDASGTWTPALGAATTGDLSVAYSVQVGRWFVVDNRMHLSWRVETSTWTHTTAASFVWITGMPTTPATVTNARWHGSGTMRYTKANFTQVSPIMASADPHIYFYATGSGQTPALLVVGETPSGTQVTSWGSIWYEV